MPLYIPFDGLPVGSLPYRGHTVPVAPKLPAPQDPLHRGLSSEDLPCREALEYLHNPPWRHFRMRTAEQMNVILVRPNRFHLDRKPFRNLDRRLLDNRCHRLIQQRLPIFHGKDNVVVELPRTVRSLSDRLVPLVRHTPEGTRNHCPRSKLRGITSSMYHAESRGDGLKTQIDKLESLAHHTVVNPTFDEFDAETEDMLINIYGANHQYVESYKYATVGEAEALVNLPESAQEPSTRDVPKKGLQQRRQVLQSILTDLQPLEAQEADLLTGEDREDPPGPS